MSCSQQMQLQSTLVGRLGTLAATAIPCRLGGLGARAQHLPERLHHRLALDQPGALEPRRGVHIAGGRDDKGREAKLTANQWCQRRGEGGGDESATHIG